MNLPHDTVVGLLDELDLFESLSDEEIDALARNVDTVSWEPGTTIFEEGDRGDSCYVIYTGSVKVIRRLVDGQPIALAQVGHGAIVGELALFASDRRSATLQAVDETTAIAISRDDLMAILHGNAEAAISMAVHVAGLLQKAEDRRFASATSTVNGRILATLLAQVEARQALHPGDGDIELVGSPTDLARLAGASKDSAVRVLHWLENEGAISLKRGRIVVRSPAALRGAPRLSRTRAAAGLCLALMVSAGAVGARAQSASPIAFDPNNAALGTALVITADGTALSSDGSPARSLAIALPRGTRVDTAARSVLCSRAQAARGTCPLDSRIGFGRFVVAVDDYVPDGKTELTWSLDAYLGRPAQRGDVASVVLAATLLGADSVAALLEPALGTSVPRTATTIGRLVRRRSGAYGYELRFPALPAALRLAAPATAAPARLELSLSAVRRTRQNFIRRYRIRTPSGYEVRRIRDHRLVGHELLRTPRSCSGSWPYELTVGFPGGVQRSAGRLPCLKALSV